MPASTEEVVGRVLARVARLRDVQGRDGPEALSAAGERIALALAGGNLPEDPAGLEEFLFAAARKGAKAAGMAELRRRRKFATGLVSEAGRPVVDLVDSRGDTRRYSLQLMTYAAQILDRGTASGSPVYASTLGRRRTEDLVLVALAAGDLTAAEASVVLGRPVPAQAGSPTLFGLSA